MRQRVAEVPAVHSDCRLNTEFKEFGVSLLAVEGKILLALFIGVNSND